MIESLRLSWGGSQASVAVAPDPLMLSDRVNGDRILRPFGGDYDSPAANLTAIDALQNSAWWRAINVISYTVARTPFHIKTVDIETNGVKKAPAKDHPGYFATTHQANPDETAFECRFRITSEAVMRGAGYGVIWRDAPGGMRIYPLETAEIRKIRRDGEVWYVRDLYPTADDAMPVAERYTKFPAKDVIEISGLRNRGMLAFATWWLAKNAIGDGIEAAKMRMARSRNKGRPVIAISTDSKLPEETVKRIQTDFMNIHAGYEGVGKPAVFDLGMKASAIPYAADFQAEETLAKIPLREIANFTGVPSVLLGDTDALSYDSLEKLIEALFRFCIEHYWSTWEDQVKAKLLTYEQRKNETHTAEFDRASMVYMDGKTQAELIRAWGAGTPIATPNNIRARLNWEPLTEPEADKLQMPKNIGNDGANNVPSPGDTAPNGRPTVEMPAVDPVRVMSLAWDDTTRRILKSAERAASNGKAFMAFCDTLDADPGVLAVAWERSRAAGAALGINVLEQHAAAGLVLCKTWLLEVAGSCKPNELHDAYHRKQGVMMVTMPDFAARAVLEACNA